MNKNNVVLQNYHDRSNDEFRDHGSSHSNQETSEESYELAPGRAFSKGMGVNIINTQHGGTTAPFPLRLHVMLSNAEENRFVDIAS